MSRIVHVGAAQLGPIQKEHTRAEVVERLITLLREAHARGCELVVFPELALTTFFPRWFVADITEADHWYETSMPNEATQPLLFDEYSSAFFKVKKPKIGPGRRVSGSGSRLLLGGQDQQRERRRQCDGGQ